MNTTDSWIIYVIETNDKKRVNVWGTTYLNQLMDEIKVNDYIRITYNGLKETKNNRQMKKYNLEKKVINNE